MKEADREIYSGRLIKVGIESVHLPNGHCIDLEIVRHPGGAVVVALDTKLRVCLLQQYRHAAGKREIWELPAGCIDPSDDSPLQTAKRELEEEAGVLAKNWSAMDSILPSPGFCDERLYLFLARDLTFVDVNRDEDEVIQVHWFALDEAIMMAASDQIEDAKTLAALFRAQQRLSAEP